MDRSRERAEGLGRQLVDVHNWIRVRLAALRDPDGTATLDDLRAHCLTLCATLSRHHRDEDDGVFPALAAEFPDLEPVLRQLRADHEAVAQLIGRLVELAGSPDRTGAVQTELDGLAALLESHFGYEERQLGAILGAPAVDLRAALPNG